MMLLAKAALGLGGTIVLAGTYTMREGVIRIDIDEFRSGGSHVHMWVPAAAVPMAMHLCLTSTGATLPNKRVKPYPFFMPSSKS